MRGESFPLSPARSLPAQPAQSDEITVEVAPVNSHLVSLLSLHPQHNIIDHCSVLSVDNRYINTEITTKDTDVDVISLL